MGVRRAPRRPQTRDPPPRLGRARAAAGGDGRAARYAWLYLYGFVRPTTGTLVWFPCNAVDAAPFAAVLARFAAAVGAGPDGRVILLVLDGAGWHGGGRLVPPEGGRLVFQPPYSPELQPAERPWPLTNEAVANRHFASLAELDAALAERCPALRDQPEVVTAHTRFHRWPEAA